MNKLYDTFLMMIGSSIDFLDKAKLDDEVTEIKKILSNKQSEQKKTKFTPDEKTLERWKSIAPTKKTLGLLGTKGLDDSKLRDIKTQYEAHIILEDINNGDKYNEI